MIHSVLIFNTSGRARLIKFYDFNYPSDVTELIVRNIFEAISSRHQSECQFIDTEIFKKADHLSHRRIGYEEALRVLYRQYATLYVVFVVDQAENELAILDLIQVFVEAMDRCFKAVCELDIIFNLEKIHWILNEIIIGGLVIETNIDEIVDCFNRQANLEQQQSNANPIQNNIKTVASLRHRIDFDKKWEEIQTNLRQIKFNKSNLYGRK
ncbi:AP-3 complex subunit sigma [Sarcoptes scabiei]|uniref:AP-3 complex subunit sigma n=1 Tax=Sarcoptes scabiei TaxID=52283 RepID=A0A834RCI1_SARSC|nr:AP-3 complex subunit sigma [Sarcoptes scabiei]